MGYNVKNYTEQGGERTVIGGELIIYGTLKAEEGASISGISPVCENQTDSTATTIAGLKDDLNALLAKLKEAGLMEADAEEPEPEETEPEGEGS